MRPDLRYVRVSYRDRIRCRSLQDEIIQRSKESGISAEHVGLLLSDLQRLEYEGKEASISSLGIVFEFSPTKLRSQYRILKGLSAAVFGEVVKATALDRQYRHARPKRLRFAIFTQFGRVVRHARQQLIRLTTQALATILRPGQRRLALAGWPGP